MPHSEQPHIRKAVDTLLSQYHQYNLAQTEEEKDSIGEAMKYADPIIWMMYKYEAYQNSDHAIDTFSDLRTHSIDHGGICAKRFKFIQSWTKDKYNVDILDSNIFNPHMSISDLFTSEIMEKLVADTECMDKWKKFEFHTINGRVAKWENFTE